MKKLILMLLVLAGGVMNVSADDYYLRGTFPGCGWDKAGTKTLTHVSGNIYKYEFGTITGITNGTSYEYKILFANNGDDGDWTGAFGSAKAGGNQEYTFKQDGDFTLTVYADVVAKKTYVSVAEESTTVYFRADYTSWATNQIELTRTSEAEFSTTLNLSSVSGAQNFKLFYVPSVGYNYGMNEYWVGEGQSSITAPTGVSSTSSGNYVLTQQAVLRYTSIDLNLTYNYFDGFAIELTPNTERTGLNKVLYNNSSSWGTVKGYAWQESNTSNNNGWPGVLLTKDGKNYAFFYNSTSNYDMVIFDNGTGGTKGTDQTNDLTLVNNKVYNLSGAVAAQNVSAGVNGKATYSSAYPLNFSSASTITPYVISELSKTSATLTMKKQAIPAETGLIIMGAASANENITPVATYTTVGTNYLKASVTATTVATDEAYILSSGQFHPANAGTIPANKAYLLASDIPTGAHTLDLVFDEGTTGINATKMANELLNNDFYNLAGQRVAQPTKGIYIVNGKKVIIK